MKTTPRNNVKAARDLRRRTTPAEDAAWVLLRDRRLAGVKFRRQHAVGPYVLDFCCAPLRLVIELDGAVHKQQVDEDALRQAELEARGYTVLRFANDAVFDQPDAFIEHVRSVAWELLSRQAPLSRAPGEGLG